MRHTLILSALAVSLSAVTAGAQTVLYTDDFSSSSASNWTALGSNTDGNGDFQVEFGFDVSANSVPNSPNGDNIALRLAANVADPAGAEAVSAFLTGFPVTTEYYEIEVDVFCGFAPPPGGTGTTRYAGVGIEHATTPIGPNHLRAGDPYQAGVNGTGQDGLVFSFNTDGDDGSGDIYLIEGNASDAFAAVSSVGTWANPEDSTPGLQAQVATFYQGFFPANADDGDATNNLLGNQWVTLTITKTLNNVSVAMYGTEVVTYTLPADAGDGLISLTNERPFGSVTPDPDASMCYFDALTITDVTPLYVPDAWAVYE